MKNLFKKILGGGSADAPKSKIQRSPRVRVSLLDESVFVTAGGKAFPLRNLSETGLALVTNGEPFPDEASGELSVAGQKISLDLRVVRRNGDEVGAVVGNGASELRGLLRRVFADEFHALEMTEVDAKLQKKVALGSPRWFYAPGNYELFFVEHEGKVIRFEMEWNGNFLSYDNGVLRFGIVEKDVREAASHARSSLVKWGDEVSADHKRKGLRLLENVPSLEAPIRQQLQKILES